MAKSRSKSKGKGSKSKDKLIVTLPAASPAVEVEVEPAPEVEFAPAGLLPIPATPPPPPPTAELVKSPPIVKSGGVKPKPVYKKFALGLKVGWWVTNTDGTVVPFHSIRDMVHRLQASGHPVKSVEAMRAFVKRRCKGGPVKQSSFNPFTGLLSIRREGHMQNLLAQRDHPRAVVPEVDTVVSSSEEDEDSDGDEEEVNVDMSEGDGANDGMGDVQVDV